MPNRFSLSIVLAILAASSLIADDDRAGSQPAQEKKAYDQFIRSLDRKRIQRDHGGSIRNLKSDEPGVVTAALRSLSATQNTAAIPWIVPFLDSDDPVVRVWAGSSLERLVSAHELKRRDLGQSHKIAIKPRGPNDLDLRPLRWVIRRMLRKNDDGNTHAYAATMIGYLGLTEFEQELRELMGSRHPAVTNAAKHALETLGMAEDFVFTPRELAAARSTAEAFTELFRKNDED
ncbi:MAG: hypothetical protein N2C14_20280, partial [Planctomycetales bacterium]